MCQQQKHSLKENAKMSDKTQIAQWDYSNLGPVLQVNAKENEVDTQTEL